MFRTLYILSSNPLHSLSQNHLVKFVLDKLLLGRGPAKEYSQYARYTTIKEHRLSPSQQQSNVNSSWARDGTSHPPHLICAGILFGLSLCNLFWMPSLLLWVHMCIYPVCFLEVIFHPWLLKSFYLFCVIETSYLELNTLKCLILCLLTSYGSLYQLLSATRRRFSHEGWIMHWSLISNKSLGLV